MLPLQTALDELSQVDELHDDGLDPHDVVEEDLALELLGHLHVALVLGVERPEGGAQLVPDQVQLDQDLGVVALGPAAHLLVLEGQPLLLAGLHAEQGDCAFAKEFEPETRDESAREGLGVSDKKGDAGREVVIQVLSMRAIFFAHFISAADLGHEQAFICVTRD